VSTPTFPGNKNLSRPIAIKQQILSDADIENIVNYYIEIFITLKCDVDII